MAAKPIPLSQAISGFIFYKSATGKSKNTIAEYHVNLRKLRSYIADDPPLCSITRTHLVQFFAWLQNGYQSEPDGVAPRGRFSLSQKSILNIHVNLSSLWAWAVEEGYAESNVVRSIAPPVPDLPVIQPFTKDEIAALLKACDRTRTWKSRVATSTTRITADRDRAIILLLLDTGLRASELCGVTLDALDLKTNSVKVLGKGRRERIVPFGRRTARALWTYITPRLATLTPTAPVFSVGPDADPRPFNRYALVKILARLGQRAGVRGVHAHRFRHTFAITFLRNGGGEFALQRILGHSTLEMVKRYTAIADSDVANAHQQASPVDNWKL